MIFSEGETETLIDLLEAVASGRALTSSARGTARGLADRFAGRQAPAPIKVASRDLDRPDPAPDLATVAPPRIDAAAIFARRNAQVVEAAAAKEAARRGTGRSS